MAKLKIGIVDSGINLKHPKFKDIKNLNCYNPIECSMDVDDEDLGSGKGHGTGCFSIILDHLKNNIDKIDFYIAKVFDKKGFTSENYLIEGIRYCVDNHVNLINLSLGIETKMPSQKLRDICEEAYNKGIIIIAAASHQSIETYPAYFPNVFGVLGGIIGSDKIFGAIENSPIELIGRGNLQRIASINGGYIFDSGNSLGTAHITGIISNLLLGHADWDFQQIKDYMFQNAAKDIKVFSNRDIRYFDFSNWIESRVRRDKQFLDKEIEEYFDVNKRLSWMKKIAIYPLSNNEMKAFRHFSDLCPFDIVRLLDYPKYAVKQKQLNIKGRTIPVNWEITDDVLDEIDTLVLGNPYDTTIELNVKLADKIIKQSVSSKKNFFVFDKIQYIELKNIINEGQANLYYPADIGIVHKIIKKVGVTEQLKTPNLAVVGVSAGSGKFTTQLKLKQVLQNSGYHVSWLSTEPQGELFGATVNFPLGFENTDLVIGSWPYFLNSVLFGIEQIYQPDIIITGHRGSLIPRRRKFFLKDNLNSLNFIASVQPDAVVCAVNAELSGDYLDRVVSTITTLFQLPILFFTLSKKKTATNKVATDKNNFDDQLLDDDEWNRTADSIRDRYKLPVVDPLNISHDSTIMESVEHYFGAGE